MVPVYLKQPFRTRFLPVTKSIRETYLFTDCAATFLQIIVLVESVGEVPVEMVRGSVITITRPKADFYPSPS
jgi:hypothetical protein